MAHVKSALSEDQLVSAEAVDPKFGFPTVQVRVKVTEEVKDDKKNGPTTEAMLIMKTLKELEHVIATET